jgi:ParB family chromosome partitioning protein
MSIKNRLNVNLGEIVKKKEEQRSSGQVVDAPKTAIGMHVDSIYHDKKITDENERLKNELEASEGRLKEFDGADVAKNLDPKLVRASKWANRSEASLASKEFESLKLEIEQSGGNVQPIKVRPLKGVAGEFEIVFGHRRHRACLELGLPVLALIDDVTDVDLFAQMDRENRQRADLRPFEQGLMYAKALDEGLFPSARKLSEALHVDLSNLGKSLSLARLPADVLNAFSSPLDIQLRWATDLTAALQKDPEIVLARAQQVKKREEKTTPKAVFSFLIDGGGWVAPPPPKEVWG